MARVRYFAAAAEAAATEQETVPAASVGELVATMTAAHGSEFERVLGRSSLLVNGRRTAVDAGDVPLEKDDSVDVLPPFAGG
ncbi:MoaD/ThiS family protein [Rathayibacter sp. YIM 133350]|uniref:MoaD/ThiS family protein n=1 Tax=Rathayibacter sp. YIM 133350 TaxID=3131992 RepID=UPI00307E7150